jgi:hypothetical protein
MNVLPILRGAFASAILVGTLLAAEDKRIPENGTPPPKPTLPRGKPGEQVKILIKQYDDAMAVLRKRLENGEDEEKLFALAPDAGDYAQLLVQIAEQNPKGSAAIEALVWIVRNRAPWVGPKESPFTKAKTILVRDYLNDAKIGPFCLTLRHQSSDPKAVAILRRVLDKNPGKEAQAHAAFTLAWLLHDRAEEARIVQSADTEKRARLEKGFGKDVFAQLKRSDADALDKEVEALLEKIRKDSDYAATTIDYIDSRRKLGDLAGRKLFEIRHLKPGKPAPEIAGHDIDGKPMKLSDFRGKVVLLDFSAHW